MQKLSRTEKYKEYRNKLKNGNEREIATKELQQLQEKIIFNEKRFGDTSRTEFDLNRGKKDSSSSIINQDYNQPSQSQSTDYLNDIFDQLNRYKNGTSKHNDEETDNRDDYIRKIRDIVYRPETQEEPPALNKRTNVNENILDLDKLVIRENKPTEKQHDIQDDYILNDIPVFEEKEETIDFPQIEEEPIIGNQPVEDKTEGDTKKSFEDIIDIDSLKSFEEEPLVDFQTSIEEIRPEPEFEIEEKHVENNQKSFEDELRAKLDFQQNIDEIKPQEQKEPITAEFVEEKPVIELPKSQLEDVQIKRPNIQPTIPQHDHSKEFEEICMNVNSLAEEIDSADSFAKDHYVPPVVTHKPENSFEGIQQNVKKDLIGVEQDNTFFNNLEKEVKQYNNEEIGSDNKSEEKPEDKRKVIVKSEISSEMKEEFDNTVSLQVDKLLGEINASKSDNISATDIMKDNDKAKKDINNHPGKTIAFEVKNEDIPDNTVVLTNPQVEDSSIRTMSFKTEDLEVEDAGKGNTVLNIILSILIVIAVGALGIIVYFFLITRGII